MQSNSVQSNRANKTLVNNDYKILNLIQIDSIRFLLFPQDDLKKPEISVM